MYLFKYKSADEILERFNLLKENDDKLFFKEVQGLPTEKIAQIHYAKKIYSLLAKITQIENEIGLRLFLDTISDNKLKISLVSGIYYLKRGLEGLLTSKNIEENEDLVKFMIKRMGKNLDD